MFVQLLLPVLIFCVWSCHGNEETETVEKLLSKLVQVPIAKDMILSALKKSDVSKRQSGWAGSSWTGGDALEPSKNSKDIDTKSNSKDIINGNSDYPPSRYRLGNHPKRSEYKKELYNRVIADVNELFELAN